MLQNIFSFINVTVYGTPEPSLATHDCIYGAFAFHLAPRMPLRCGYNAHHTTSPVCALYPCFELGLDLRYNTIRYTPTCDVTLSIGLPYSHILPSFILPLFHQLPPAFETLS